MAYNQEKGCMVQCLPYFQATAAAYFLIFSTVLQLLKVSNMTAPLSSQRPRKLLRPFLQLCSSLFPTYLMLNRFIPNDRPLTTSSE